MADVEILRLPSRFDYSHHRQFSDSYAPYIDNDSIKEVVLDFSHVEYLDSSALGMMVMMQKKITAKGKTVKVNGARGATEEILKMANMQKLFEFV